MIRVLVRHTPTSACIAHAEESAGSLQLVRVTPDAGPAPDVADLIGECFPDKKSLRIALVARLRDAVTGIDTTNLLDRVYLSRNACSAWQKIADGVDLSAFDSPESVPLEQAEVVGKRLRIWVDMPDDSAIEYFVPPGEWSWKTGGMAQ